MNYVIFECGEFPSLGGTWSTHGLCEAVQAWKHLMETSSSCIPTVGIETEELVVELVGGRQFDFEMLNHIKITKDFWLATCKLIKAFLKAGVCLSKEQEKFIKDQGEKIMNTIMEYEEFKEAVRNNLCDYLPTGYTQEMVRMSNVNKVNRVLDGISIVTKQSDREVEPTVYINDMYEKYRRGLDLSLILEQVARSLTETMTAGIDVNIDDVMSADYVREHVRFQLINTELNKGLLSEVPHREFLNLSVIYYIDIETKMHGVNASSIINNKMLEKIGLSEGQLFDLSEEHFSPEIQTMNDIFKEAGKDDMECSFMYVLSDENHMKGAVAMLYEDVLFTVAETLKSDLYVLPSSIHEVLIIGTDTVDDLEALTCMVSEVNRTLDIGDLLSDHVYIYDRDLREVRIADN